MPSALVVLTLGSLLRGKPGRRSNFGTIWHRLFSEFNAEVVLRSVEEAGCRRRFLGRPRSIAKMDAFLGKELSLVTKMNIRYQGVLTDIDFETHALTLVNGAILVYPALSTLLLLC